VKLERGPKIRRSYNHSPKKKSYKVHRPSQISFIAYTAKIVVSIHVTRRRIGRKIKDVFGAKLFRFRRGKATLLGC
jgi:hypothetical protein